jgi:hypothetical protein
MKKKTIKVMKTNHNQYWNCKIWTKKMSSWIVDGEAIKGSG